MIKTVFNLIFLFCLSFVYTQTSLNLEWKSRGPSNISGITRAILWDKDDENVLYSGGIASGLYKSINKGEVWSKVESYADNNPSIVSFAQSINGTIFVGTGFIAGYPDGSKYNLAFRGSGIYKSQDSGNSWSHINATSVGNNIGEWSNIYSMAAHPTNSNILLIGNREGLRISHNAESAQPTFINISGISGSVLDVKFTNNGLEAWATANGRIYHSTDYANNFVSFNLNSPSVSATRAQLAISSVDNNGNYTIYASFSSLNGCLAGIFKSEDKGANWVQIVAPGGLDPFQIQNGGCQGWHSHSLAINPIIEDIIYVGGQTLYTLNTAGNLVQIDDINNENASNYLAKDKHFMILNPHNGNQMMIGTDDGIYLSENAQSGYPDNFNFTSKKSGLNNNITMNADIGKNGGILIAGYNRNDYIDYNQSNPYEAFKLLDSGNANADISNYEESVLFFSGIYGYLKRSIDNGITSSPFLDNNIDPYSCGAITCSFLSPPLTCEESINQSSTFFSEKFLYDSETNSKYFIPTQCGSDFFVCINPLSLTDAPIYNSFQIPLQSGTKAIDVSSNGDRLVLGSAARVIVVDSFESFVPSIPNNQSSNTAQIDIKTYNLSSLGIQSVSGIAIDKNNKDHILVTEDQFGSDTKVAKTTDGGLNWEIIHNDLPEIPIYDCIIDANNSDTYILATEEGIFTSDNAGINWQTDNNGIGKLPIFKIRQEWVLEENCYVLIATTVGNGVYTSTTLTNCNKDVEEEIWGEYNPINQVENQNFNFNVYPNPTKDIIQIDLESNEKNIVKVYDVFGKQVYSNTINSRLEIETNDWAPGMYYISIKNTTVKIIILK